MSLKDFQIIAKLGIQRVIFSGEGAYSSVYKVKRIHDGQEYALKKVKMMDLSDKEKQNALNEVRILASIRHPGIIGYKEVFFTENLGSLWFSLYNPSIIMDYSNKGDLY